MRRDERDRGARQGGSPGKSGSSWWLTALLLLAAAGVLAWRFDLIGRLRPGRGPEPPTVRIAGHVFAVELPRGKDAIELGLGNRPEVPAGHGMLFIYAAPLRPDQMTFWMKNCLVGLDIAFISADRRIVNTLAMKAQPPNTPEKELERYHPTAPAQFALEVAGGEFARLGIRAGDAVEFSPQVEQAVRAAPQAGDGLGN